MLITEETQKKIESAVTELGQNFADSILNRVTASYLPSFIQSDSPLEDSYYLGKLAGQIGPNKVTRMNPGDLSGYFTQAHSIITPKDRDTLDNLNQQVKSYITSRTASWVNEIRRVILNVNRDWMSSIEEGSTASREDALTAFLLTQKDVFATFRSDVDRISQSELLHYFQKGQVRDLPSDTPVYKIPRNKSCKFCLKLHVEDDGSPKVSTVAAASRVVNNDRPSWNWGMSVGPTHPYCYCILYTANVNPIPGPSKSLHTALKLSKSQPSK